MKKKNPYEKKKISKFFFDEQEKSKTYLKIPRKKCKNFKAMSATLSHTKPKIFCVGKPW